MHRFLNFNYILNVNIKSNSCKQVKNVPFVSDYCIGGVFLQELGKLSATENEGLLGNILEDLFFSKRGKPLSQIPGM